MKEKPRVAFICVHNSCRSQIAEALGKYMAKDVFDSYSAGTEAGDAINRDAVRIMKKLYGINIEETQYSKLLQELPVIYIVITMGCDVKCPYLPCKYREDWKLDDPTGHDDEMFEKTIKTISEKILVLKEKIQKEIYSK